MINPVLAMGIGIAVMMVLIIFTKMHAFPALIISAILIAILAMPFGDVKSLKDCVDLVATGFGNSMKSIGIVIGFGCIMGIFLEKSGAAKRMALTILKAVGVKNCDVVLGLTGFVVSIPVFCDSGFVILSSLAKEFSRLTKKTMVCLGGILAMGLNITHLLVPPTPGPLAVVSTFQQNGLDLDLGLFIILGIIFGIPVLAFAVFLFRYFGRKYPNFVVENKIDRSQYSAEQLAVLDRIEEKSEKGEELVTEDFEALLAAENLPNAILSFATLLVPILLIFANTIVSQIHSLDGTAFAKIIMFTGQPIIALFISVVMAVFLLCSSYDRKTCVNLMNEACKDAGPIVFITAAGGALGAVINATGAAKIMADWIVATGVPGIFVPIIIGVVMKFPQGSGTTAMITGSTIVAPMVGVLGLNPYIAALALCLATMCPSYLNDSYFHVITNFSGLDIKTSLKTWTIGSILVPAAGSLILIVLSFFIH